MKMIYRLNLSFGLLLICIMAITAALIYPLLFNTLVDNQRREMRAQGNRLVTAGIPAVFMPGGQETEESLQSNFIPMGGVGAVLTSPTHNIIYSNLPQDKATEWLDILKQDQSKKDLWYGKDRQYIVETLTAYNSSIPFTNGITATMFMPIDKIKSMQAELFERMMIILSIGGLLTFLLCMYITRRIVTPLGKLRKEIEKVESRSFSEVQLIKAGGEIGEVAKSVYQLAAELEKYQLTQRQFFQNASHELKTPLMSIQGYAEGIKDGIFTGGKAEKGLDVIVNECERLKKIVTEMILLAKLESEDGIFKMDRVPVQDLISETVDRINPLLVKRGLQVQINYTINEKDRYIYADREKVLQALINIIGNATRYANHMISIHATANVNSINIEISDDGTGIPEQLLPHLFGRFAKGKNGDTGLGLAISRAIVERCHGQITARNLPKGGAAFVMCFPISK